MFFSFSKLFWLKKKFNKHYLKNTIKSQVGCIEFCWERGSLGIIKLLWYVYCLYTCISRFCVSFSFFSFFFYLCFCFLLSCWWLCYFIYFFFFFYRHNFYCCIHWIALSITSNVIYHLLNYLNSQIYLLLTPGMSTNTMFGLWNMNRDHVTMSLTWCVHASETSQHSTLSHSNNLRVNKPLKSLTYPLKTALVVISVDFLRYNITLFKN